MANYKDITSEDRENLFECPVPQPPIVNQQFPNTGKSEFADFYLVENRQYFLHWRMSLKVKTCNMIISPTLILIY